MRPDPASNLAGEESEYGDDTGFAAEATRTEATRTEATRTGAPSGPDGGNGAAGPPGDPDIDAADETAGLTAEDD